MEADQGAERRVSWTVSLPPPMNAEIEALAREIGEMKSVMIRTLLREALDARRQASQAGELVGSVA